MGWGAGRKLGQILDNTVRVLAIELMCAAQGIDYRRPAQPAPRTMKVWKGLREVIPPLIDDRPVGDEIEAVAGLIDNGTIDRLAGFEG